MIDKNDYLKKLRTHSDYLAILKTISDVKERKRAIDVVEEVAGGLFDAIFNVVAKTKQDPTIIQQITEALKTGEGIIKESDGLPVSNESEEK